MRWSWLSLGLCLPLGCSGAGDVGLTDVSAADAVVAADAGEIADGGFDDAEAEDRRIVRDLGSADWIIMDPPRCPMGTEGCRCRSNRAPDSPSLTQSNCQFGLLCADWDRRSGRTDLTGEFQSCVFPCFDDDECGAGRFCRPTGLGPESGAERVCVDRVASNDQYCGLTKLGTSVDPRRSVEIQTGGEIVGCDDSTECVPDAYSLTHVGEGICLRFCDRNEDCDESAPFCNPSLIDTSSAGAEPPRVCQSELPSHRQACGSTRRQTAGIANGCDAQSATPLACVQYLQGVSQLNGICMATCTSTSSCSDGSRCVVDPLRDGRGYCSDDCNRLPESCTATAASGRGYSCVELNQPEIARTAQTVSQCTERRTPGLEVSTIDASGQFVDRRDFCSYSDGFQHHLRCPFPSSCRSVDDRRSTYCLVGCVVGSSTTTCPADTGIAGSWCVDDLLRPGEGVCVVQ